MAGQSQCRLFVSPLRLHHETRELPIYVLTVVKSGARLVEWKDTVGPSCRYVAGELTCHKVAVTDLARELPRRLGREVRDKTLLTGPYDLMLHWTPDEFQTPGPAEMGKAEQSADPAGPSLVGALQEQLGLRLEAVKGPVDVLVIDYAEKPSEN